jgi:hypothetical protein
MVPDSPPLLGAWMTFKKAEMAKINLRSGLSMSETDPLSHKWLDFEIYLGLALHQFKKTAVKVREKFW